MSRFASRLILHHEVDGQMEQRSLSYHPFRLVFHRQWCLRHFPTWLFGSGSCSQAGSCLFEAFIGLLVVSVDPISTASAHGIPLFHSI